MSPFILMTNKRKQKKTRENEKLLLFSCIRFIFDDTNNRQYLFVAEKIQTSSRLFAVIFHQHVYIVFALTYRQHYTTEKPHFYLISGAVVQMSSAAILCLIARAKTSFVTRTRTPTQKYTFHTVLVKASSRLQMNTNQK